MTDIFVCKFADGTAEQGFLAFYRSLPEVCSCLGLVFCGDLRHGISFTPSSCNCIPSFSLLETWNNFPCVRSLGKCSIVHNVDLWGSLLYTQLYYQMLMNSGQTVHTKQWREVVPTGVRGRVWGGGWGGGGNQSMVVGGGGWGVIYPYCLVYLSPPTHFINMH